MAYAAQAAQVAQQLITPPYAEPVHLAEAKLWLRQEETADDALIDQAIADARRECEDRLSQQLIAATWKLLLDEFPGWAHGCDDTIRVPLPPLIAVSSIKYLDTAGVQQTLSAADYLVDAASRPGRIAPAYGKIWPSTRDQQSAVEVTFVNGYATPFTVDAGTDVLSVKGRTVANNDVVRLSNSGGALPAGLARHTDYHVVQSTGSTCKLSATQGGAEIDLLDVGSGTHFLGEVPGHVLKALRLLLTWDYEHREPTANDLQRVHDLLWLAWHGEYV